jgi:hypothetical protein
VVHVHRAVLAGGVRIDTGFVVAEATDNLESDGYGSYHEEVVAHVIFVQGNVVGAANDTHGSHLGLESAGEGLSLVGVVSLSGNTTRVHKVFEGMGRKTAVAAIVVEISSAINELLLTQISELTVLLHEVRFKSSNCGESPAAATLALVLHWGHDTEVSPVPVSRNILQWEFHRLSVLS